MSPAARTDGAGDARPERDDAAPTIQSVERAARILGFFTVSRPRLTLSEITARLGMSKATAHRYAMALRQVNLLRYEASSGEYTLGPEVLVLAAAARAALPIVSLAGPLMEQLVREVNETVVLSVWDGEAPVVVRVDDGTDRVIRVSVRAGARLSPFASAQGRAFSAFLPPGAVPGLTAELDSVPALAGDLEAVRRAGIAVNRGERHGVRTIAAPVFADGRIVAVLALVGTTTTLSDGLDSGQAQALRRTARRLTDVYGRGELGEGEPGEDGQAARAQVGGHDGAAAARHPRGAKGTLDGADRPDGAGRRRVARARPQQRARRR
jgi:IclR family pca regulon transcriptional regulator